MDNENEIPFEQWFDIFIDEMRAYGWLGFIDRESAMSDYDNGASPENAAKSLWDELKMNH